MILLNEKQIRKLKVGDEVVYKERSGALNMYFYRAKVIGVYPYFVTLNVAANKNFNDAYEDAQNYFNTSVCYNDDVTFGGYKLYRP